MDIKEFERPNRPSNREANAITRESLFEALLILVEKKPFEKITVSELVKRAGVSRTAFYRNYNSISEIVEERLLGLLDTLRASLDEPRYAANMHSWYFDMLTYLKENHAFMLEILLRATHADFLEMRVLGGVYEKMSKLPEKRLGYTAFNGAAREMLSLWVLGGCAGDVGELSDMLFKLQRLCFE